MSRIASFAALGVAVILARGSAAAQAISAGARGHVTHSTIGPGNVVDARASRVRHGALVAWSTSHVRRSLDDGTSWRTIAVERQPPDALAVGDDGTVFFVRRTHELITVDTAGHRSSRPLPFADRTLRILARGRWLVWVGHRRAAMNAHESIAVSSDGGARWSRTDPTTGNQGFDASLSADGGLHWMAASEAACGGGGQWLQHGHVDGRPWQDGVWPLDSPVAWALGARGVSIGVAEAGDATAFAAPTIVALDSSIPRAIMPYSSGCSSGTFSVVHNDRVTLVRSCERIGLDDGIVGRVLETQVPPTLRVVDLDASDRALAVDRGTLLRRDGPGSWRTLSP